VLYGVSTIDKPIYESLERFLARGGSLFVVPTLSTDARGWNDTAFQSGKGWLPARLTEVSGGEAKPLLESFSHPALDLFKEPLPGGLHTALFLKHWSLDLNAGINGTTGGTVGRLSNNAPLFAEKGVGRGRVLLSAVTFDKSAEAVFVQLPDFVRLAHELLYYLAGAKSAERNIAPGQPIVFAPFPAESPQGVTVIVPDGSSRTLPVASWPLVFEGTKDAGAYKLTTAGGRTFYYAARGEPQESQLAGCTEADEKLVATLVPGLSYIATPDDIQAAAGEGPIAKELWWILLLMVIALLAVELLYARKLGKAADDLN
jgi:hypothetical protein